MVSKLVWRIGRTFIKALKSLKICTFMGSFCPKHNVSARKFQRNYVSWYWKVMQNLKENWLMAWKMTQGIWLIFMQATESLQISAKKVQKSYLSWHWRLIKTLKKNSFFVWNMTWESSWILSWAVENLKIFTLMGYFYKKYVMLKLIKYRWVLSWKMTYGFKNDIRNLVNFYSSWK